MAPVDLPPFDSPSDAESPAPEPGAGDLRLLVAQLSARVVLLEQTVARLDPSLSTPSIPAPPPVAPTAPATRGALLPEAGHSPQARQKDPPRSLEDRLGSQIFNRVGIIAILIGATWFLKLAMDNHWIGPLGRILIGLIAGAGIVFWSERFRRDEFATFSYSLKAVGTGVLYLSLWAAFQLYHLLPAQAAFVLMLLVTLWNAWMAWSRQSEVLAAYAVAGAFATPALLSIGGNHQVFLFSYLLSIDIAAIVLVSLAAARLKPWSRLLLAVLPATVAYFINWYSRFYTADQLASTSIFIALFFAAFFTVPFRKQRTPSTVAAQPDLLSDVLVPLTNAVFAALAFYSVLQDSGNHTWLPWVALVFAAIYLAAMRLPVFARLQTATARGVHLSLAVLFLTIAIPLKANGRWITIGWLAEGVALLWVSSHLSIDDSPAGTSIHPMLRRLAMVALALGLFGLLITPFWLDRSIHPAIVNRRFATELAGMAAFATATWISLRARTARRSSGNPAPSGEVSAFPDWLQFASAAIVAFNLIALQAGVAEIQTFWAPGQGNMLESSLQTALTISAFLMLYGATLLASGFWKHSAFLRWQGLALLVVAILKTFLYDVRSLSQGYRVASFLGLGALLMAVSFAYVRKSGKTSLDDHP